MNRSWFAATDAQFKSGHQARVALWDIDHGAGVTRKMRIWIALDTKGESLVLYDTDIQARTGS